MYIFHTVNINGCSIISNSPDAVGRPTFGFRYYTTYSCLSRQNKNNYSIHVISVHEACWFPCFERDYNARVLFNMTESFTTIRPLILVLVNSEPVQWEIHMPEGITIAKVVLVSRLHA